MNLVHQFIVRFHTASAVSGLLKHRADVLQSLLSFVDHIRSVIESECLQSGTEPMPAGVPFESLWRALNSDPYAHVATMHRSCVVGGLDAMAVRCLATRAFTELDIVATCA